MPLDPFIAKIPTPLGSGHSASPRRMSPRLVKILIAIASTIMIISMVTFTIFSIMVNNKEFSKKQGLDSNDQAAQDQGSKSQLATPGGNAVKGTGGTSGTNAPVVTLVAEPASVSLGGISKLTWEATNNPSSCLASDDWSGSRPAKGSETTPKLDKVQTYLFTITCKTATGTGFSSVSIGAVAQGGSGSVTQRPTVKLALQPSSVFSGESSTLVWDVTNNPTNCTASGDWNGIKSAVGTESTGKKTTVKQYTYTLTCKNDAGSGYATATLQVQDLPPDVPIINIESNPVGPIKPGQGVALTWTVANNPSTCVGSDDLIGTWTGASAANGSKVITNMTAIRTYFFTLTCTNVSATRTDTASVAVVPDRPNTTLGLAPQTITTLSTSMLTWSGSNSPDYCDATGSWTGRKTPPAGGSVQLGPLAKNTYTYNLSCTNAGGTSPTASATLTVNDPPKPVVTLVADQISLPLGNSGTTLRWSATGASVCVASGDWSGSKTLPSGSFATGALPTARAYTYTLDCSIGTVHTTTSARVDVTSVVSTSPPVVSLSRDKSAINASGSDASSIQWSATNNPTSCTGTGNGWVNGNKSASGPYAFTTSTPGSYTFTLICANSAGTSPAVSVSVSAVAVPTVTLSISPQTLTTGQMATVTWTTSNNPASCTVPTSGANASWSGSKLPSGGTQQVAFSSTGTYNFSIECKNSIGDTGGTVTSNVVSVTVSGVVYCGGQTPCYSATELNTHTSSTNCWAYNTSSNNPSSRYVYNITSFNNNWHKSRRNLLPDASTVSAICGAHDIAPYLAGSASIGGASRSHLGSTRQNTNTTLNNVSYRVGYYDPAKP